MENVFEKRKNNLSAVIIRSYVISVMLNTYIKEVQDKLTLLQIELVLCTYGKRASGFDIQQLV